MKKGIWLAIVVAVLVLLAFTCPKKEQHMDAIMNKVSAVTEKKLAESTGDSGWGKGLAVFGSMVTNQLVKLALENSLVYDNYVFFSLAKMEYDGEMKTISVGALNQIFTFSEKDLEDVIDGALEK